jgi:hypothetical protein
MELPAFAKRRSELVWTRDHRTLTAHTPEVSFTAESTWYLPGRWVVAAVSTMPIPVDVTLYIAKSGAAHGYWRNAPPGLRDYFGYCDVPALMPILVGRHTLHAIVQHDNDPQNTRNPVELHVHERRVETTTKVSSSDADIIDDQLAIHQALAADHAEVVDAWKDAADALRGIVATSWPPVITVPRAFGPTSIALRWPSTTQTGARATIELTADARGAPLWLMEREYNATPASKTIAGAPFLVVGEPPIPLDQIARVVERASILSIMVRRHITVQSAAHAPDARALESVLELIGAICGAGAEPYR